MCICSSTLSSQWNNGIFSSDTIFAPKRLDFKKSIDDNQNAFSFVWLLSVKANGKQQLSEWVLGSKVNYMMSACTFLGVFKTNHSLRFRHRAKWWPDHSPEPNDCPVSWRRGPETQRSWMVSGHPKRQKWESQVITRVHEDVCVCFW